MWPDQARGKKMRQKSFSFSSITLPLSADIAGSVAILKSGWGVAQLLCDWHPRTAAWWADTRDSSVYEPEEPESVASPPASSASIKPEGKELLSQLDFSHLLSREGGVKFISRYIFHILSFNFFLAAPLIREGQLYMWPRHSLTDVRKLCFP